MRLEGLCQKRHSDGFRGTSCILYVHKHRATSPRDDECGRAPYDERGRTPYDECECARCECTQMRVFMKRMTLWGSANLRTLLQISLTRGSRGCASTLGIHSRTCESCVGKYYTSNLSETGGHP